MVFTWCLTLNKFKHQWYCRRFSEGEINDLFYLQIPHYEWNSMELSTQDAWKEYLRKKIFKEGSSWWTYLLNNESHVTLSTELWVWFGEFWGWTTEQRFKKKTMLIYMKCSLFLVIEQKLSWIYIIHVEWDCILCAFILKFAF